MTDQKFNTHKGFIQLSAKIGENLDLVQGAGGNTSFKDGEILWVKASGCWLSDAGKKDIFVPVNRSGVLTRLDNNESDPVTPEVLDIEHKYNKLKPSIETSLHALMPHRYVIHTHSVNILASVITMNGQENISKMLKGLRWVWIPYVRPGLPLTQAIRLASKSQPDIMVLENHGIVFGAESVEEITQLMNDIEARVRKDKRAYKVDQSSAIYEIVEHSKYQLLNDPLIQSIAFDSIALSIIKRGVSYPDHVVFLGPDPLRVLTIKEFKKAIKENNKSQNVVFVESLGVFTLCGLDKGAIIMLHCLANVLLRINLKDEIKYLTLDEIKELVEWDAEKYRQNLNIEGKS